MTAETEASASIVPNAHSNVGGVDSKTMRSSGEEPSVEFVLTVEDFDFALLGNFVAVPTTVLVSDQMPDLAPYEDGWSEQDEIDASSAIADDPAWHTEDGELFEAILVLEDGSAWGRIGAAGDWPQPTKDDGFGASMPGDGELAALADALATIDAGGANAARSLVVASLDPQPTYTVCRSVSCDSRSRLTYPFFPEYLIGQLSQQAAAGAVSQTCTGAKIGPRVVLTNAHCVYNGGVWTTSGWWHPGQMGLDHHPSADYSAVPWSGTLARDPSDKNYDYAIIYLADRDNVVGRSWFGINWWNSASSYDGKSVYVSGYPGYTEACAADPLNYYNWCAGWQYRDDYTLTASDYGTGTRWGQLSHEVMTNDSQSGSPVFRSTHAEAILGVHWGWTGLSATKNWAVRFRSAMYNDVCSWIASGPTSQYATHPNCN